MSKPKCKFFACTQPDGLHIIEPFNEIVIPKEHLPRMAELMMKGHDFSYDGANNVLIDDTEQHFVFLKTIEIIKLVLEKKSINNIAEQNQNNPDDQAASDGPE